jgi:cellulose synthase/poly-beta-1,6-N-acetylglucosamine synthase-like glycosyltransferase
MPPAVTVILTTHNNPRALEFCLTGFACQDFRDFEIIVADDGSRDETRDMVRKMRAEFAASAPWLKITHLWQPHRGYYGKAAIVNKAIVYAKTDYLILADGDVIPRKDHVRTHMEMRKPNCFLAGGDFRLVDASTKGLTLDDVRSGRAFTKEHLMKLGHPKTKKFIKLTPRGWFTEFFDWCNVSPARWSGSNASCWRELLIKANGFDESFKSWGKDDTELGTRLWNAGVKSRHVRHNAIVMHMYHGESKFTPEGKVTNLGLLADTKKTKRTRARIGIDERVDDLRIETQNP